jgi:HEPN domain-containing protein
VSPYTFNFKQDILSYASASVDGKLKKEDWAVFNSKQDVSPYVSSLVNVIVPKAKFDY